MEIRTRTCNTRATCNCGVAVRSGLDVFVIDLCPNEKRQFGFARCDEGTLIATRIDDYRYEVCRIRKMSSFLFMFKTLCTCMRFSKKTLVSFQL